VIKTVLIIAAIAGAVYAGAKYLQDEPRTVDIQKIQQQPYQLPGPQNPK
jgi:hypothetical protein